ncbi:TPA: hypothetical protein ACJ2UI_002809 [Yersinia enterocolitica]
MKVTNENIIAPSSTILYTRPTEDILASHSIEELKYKYDHANNKEKSMLEKEILKYIILTFDSKSYNSDSEYFLLSEEKSLEFASNLVLDFSKNFKLDDIQKVISDSGKLDFTAYHRKISKHETDGDNTHVYKASQHEYWNNHPYKKNHFMEKKLDILMTFMNKYFPEG